MSYSGGSLAVGRVAIAAAITVGAVLAAPSAFAAGVTPTPIPTAVAASATPSPGAVAPAAEPTGTPAPTAAPAETAEPTPEVALTGTPVPSTAPEATPAAEDCPTGLTAYTNLIDVDGAPEVTAGYGTVTVALPALALTDCASAGYLIVSASSIESEEPVADERIDIPTSGYPGGDVVLAVNGHGKYEVTITVWATVDDELAGASALSRTIYVPFDAIDACTLGGSPFVSTPTAQATGGSGSITVALGATDVLPCIDDATVTVTAYNEGARYTLLTADPDDFAGATTTTSVPAGAYTVFSDISVTVDGETATRYGHLMPLLPEGHLVDVTAPVVAAPVAHAPATPRAVAGGSATTPAKHTSSARHLAETGAEPILPLTAGVTALLLGAGATVFARRRRTV